MFYRPLFPNHSIPQLKRTVAQFLAEFPSQPIDTIDLHVRYGGGGCSDPGTTVMKSRLAAFGRFVAKHATAIGIHKIDKRKNRCDPTGRRTTCAVWMPQS